MKMMDIQDFSSKELLICKIVLLGEAKAGKTTLLTSYISNEYTPCYVPTKGAALYKKIEYFKDLNCSIKFKIWDVPGQERYRSIADIFMGNAKALILV
jgi:small GTP-binding protein